MTKIVAPTTNDMLPLREKLLKFDSFDFMALITQNIYSAKRKEDFDNNFVRNTRTLNVHVTREEECQKIEIVIREHFNHLQNFIFYVRFFIPGEKENTWKESKKNFCIFW